MKQLIRNLAYQLTRKRVEESTLAVCEIRKKRDELSVFSLSTNTIVSFEYDGEIHYFRECPGLLSPDGFWRETIRRFFDSLDHLGISRDHFAQEIPVRICFDEGEKQSFRAYIESRADDPEFLNMLKNADKTSKRMGFSIWEHQRYDSSFFEAFSLAELPENCRDIAVYFLWNMRGAAGSYRLLKLARGKHHCVFAAVRAAASRIVAEELGIAHLITPAVWCRLIIDDADARLGILSPAAPGRRMLDADIAVTASLQRELLCLNVLDVICNQTDHGPNNYSVAVDSAGEMSVCAFDNDNPQTFFPVCTISRPLAGCEALADRGLRIRRPYMDRELADRLRTLDRVKLSRRLRPYLNGLQIAAVRYRLRLICKAIARTETLRPGFLLERTEWNAETVEEEITGKYGQTYLKRISSQRADMA